MARICEICGKGTVFGNTVSHAKNKVRRMWRPNLLAIRAKVGKEIVNLKICTRCLKAGKVEKVV